MRTKEWMRSMTVVTDSGCWEWQMSRTDGYGQLYHAGRTRKAHRVAELQKPILQRHKDMVRAETKRLEHNGRILDGTQAITPEDIAAAVAFLAGPDAAFITGQNLVIDGGLTQAGLELIARSHDA